MKGLQPRVHTVLYMVSANVSQAADEQEVPLLRQQFIPLQYIEMTSVPKPRKLTPNYSDFGVILRLCFNKHPIN